MSVKIEEDPEREVIEDPEAEVEAIDVTRIHHLLNFNLIFSTGDPLQDAGEEETAVLPTEEVEGVETTAAIAIWKKAVASIAAKEATSKESALIWEAAHRGLDPGPEVVEVTLEAETPGAENKAEALHPAKAETLGEETANRAAPGRGALALRRTKKRGELETTIRTGAK